MKQFGILAAAAAMAGLEIFPSVFGDAVPSGGPSAMTPALEPPVLFRSDAALISPAPPEAEKEVDEISSEEEVDDVSDEEEDDESSDEGESDESSDEGESDGDPDEEEGDEVSLGFTKRDDGPFGNGTLAKRGYCKPRPKPKPRTCPRKGHKLSSGSVCKKYKRCRQFKARDGCSTCKCVKGRAHCTKKRCPKPTPKPKPRTCPRKGHKLSNGSVCKKYKGCRKFKARDGCNTCKCVKGRAQCTKKRCPKPRPKPKPRTCPRKGHKLSNGSVCKKYKGCRKFKAKDGCNTCRCVKGRAHCTKKRCPTPRPKPKPKTCPRKGHKLSNESVCKKYKGCRQFKARDRCNTCRCVKGRAQCTKKRCPKPTPKPKTKWCYYNKGAWHCRPRTPRCKLVL